MTAIEEAFALCRHGFVDDGQPGFGSQQFIPTMTDKIRRLRQRLDDLDRPIHLQIDGGVYLGNIRELYQAGANMIVVGQAVYGQPDPAAALRALRACAV